MYIAWVQRGSPTRSVGKWLERQPDSTSLQSHKALQLRLTPQPGPKLRRPPWLSPYCPGVVSRGTGCSPAEGRVRVERCKGATAEWATMLQVMLAQPVAPAEGLAAVCTGEWLLLRVDLLAQGKVGLAAEGLAALCTHEGPLAGVQMQEQQPTVLEGTSALSALQLSLHKCRARAAWPGALLHVQPVVF